MKPILFNGEMVKAILEDRKTVTRRIVKPQPTSSMFTGVCTESTMRNDRTVGCFMFGDNYGEVKEYAKPPYKVGDILYVRETWCYGSDTMECLFDESIKCNDIFYKASWDKENYVKWRPSIHMPKEAARIFLKVINVRIERLQDMKNEDSFKEGINSCVCMSLNHALTKFKLLWDSTIKKEQVDQYSWMANPWVWVIEFERVEKQNISK